MTPPFAGETNRTTPFHMQMEHLDATVTWVFISKSPLVISHAILHKFPTCETLFQHAPYDGMIMVSLSYYIDCRLRASGGKWKVSHSAMQSFWLETFHCLFQIPNGTKLHGITHTFLTRVQIWWETYLSLKSCCSDWMTEYDMMSNLPNNTSWKRWDSTQPWLL